MSEDTSSHRRSRATVSRCPQEGADGPLQPSPASQRLPLVPDLSALTLLIHYPDESELLQPKLTALTPSDCVLVTRDTVSSQAPQSTGRSWLAPTENAASTP